MKEKLYTIELTDAVNAGDECCFCWLERKLEQENLEFTLGSSYMESDIREQTSERGFCRRHTKMMYDYGNTVGNAWILKSRMEYLRARFSEYACADGGGTDSPGQAETKMTHAKKESPFSRLMGAARRSDAGVGARGKGLPASSEETCYICHRMKGVYDRMMDTFVYLLLNEEGFGRKLMESKGFCFRHFEEAAQVCERKMKPADFAVWMPRLTELMSRNLDRVQEDVDWLIEKFDYRNQDADWKSSRDAVQRAMQKMVGGYPADPVFRR